MVKKEIQLLQDQITKLDDKGFDLESWKIYTIGLLDRLFGHNSHKINQMKELDFENKNGKYIVTRIDKDKDKDKDEIIKGYGKTIIEAIEELTKKLKDLSK